MSKQGLPPLLCENPRILILGSLPGDKSIEMHQYYGHPRNRFWQVMSSVLRKPLPEDFAGRKKLLSDAGIILKDNPTIRVIAANGKTTLRKLVNQWKRILIDPSSL